jgi:hypothetical protein
MPRHNSARSDTPQAQDLPGSDRHPTAEPPSSSPAGARRIFRAEALEHHKRRQDQVVLPRLVSPHLFIYLWLIGGLLLVLGFAVAFWPVLAMGG